MKINSFIDHTLLKPEATQDQIINLCKEALEHQFFGVCVNSSWIPTVANHLKGSSVKSVAVIGFPLGAASTAAKCFEAEWCVKNGAAEIDMVIHLGHLKDRALKLVQADISAVVSASSGAIVKVILETGLLSNEEKRLACELAVAAKANFVKTSTGFNLGGATLDDILLMRSAVGPSLGVKASGGIKTTQQALALLDAGATRLGTSSGVALVLGQAATGGY